MYSAFSLLPGLISMVTKDSTSLELKKSVHLLCDEKDLNFLLRIQTIDQMNRKQYTKTIEHVKQLKM